MLETLASPQRLLSTGTHFKSIILIKVVVITTVFFSGPSLKWKQRDVNFCFKHVRCKFVNKSFGDMWRNLTTSFRKIVQWTSLLNMPLFRIYIMHSANYWFSVKVVTSSGWIPNIVWSGKVRETRKKANKIHEIQWVYFFRQIPSTIMIFMRRNIFIFAKFENGDHLR